MTHPADWGIGPMGVIALADVVIKYDDENVPEVLKDRATQLDSKVPHIRIVFIDQDGNRHIFVGNRVR